MPYISEERRNQFDNGDFSDLQPGDVNYVVTRLLDQYIDQEGLSYTSINAMIGVLECAKLELYRRIAVPYEDRKIEENGDVYECNLNT
jgi:hypothetical protein